MLKNRSSHRGAASVEALCVLFTITILWAGVAYMGKTAALTIEAKSVARGCAWQAAVNGCGEMPPDCRVEEMTGEEFAGKTKELRKEADETNQGSWLSNIFSDALKSRIEGVFSKRAGAIESTEITQPKLLGGETVEVGASYSLPCNSTGESVKDRMSSMVKEATTGIFGADQ